MAYQPLIYKESGGDTLVIKAADGAVVKGQASADATPAQSAHIADASVAYTAGDLDAESEIITAINTTNGKINSILAALEKVGILAAS